MGRTVKNANFHKTIIYSKSVSEKTGTRMKFKNQKSLIIYIRGEMDKIINKHLLLIWPAELNYENKKYKY